MNPRGTRAGQVAGVAVHLWFGRILSVFLFVLLGLAGPAWAGHFLTHPAATPQGAAGPQVVAAAARDANVYITPRNIPKNDQFLKAYSADKAVRSNGTAAPGLRGIATQAYRTRASAATANKAYSLADAMRDAVWRKKTAAKLKSLMSTQRACAGGAGDTSRGAPSIGFGATC